MRFSDSLQNSLSDALGFIPEDALGAPNVQNRLKGCPREAEISQSSPKEVQREAQMLPRGARGSPKDSSGNHFGVNSRTEEVRIE